MVTGQVVTVVKTLNQTNFSLRAVSTLDKHLTYISVVVVRTTGVDVTTTGGGDGTELVLPAA